MLKTIIIYGWVQRSPTKAEIMHYLGSAPSGHLKFYPIIPWVNSLKHDDQRGVQPA